MGGCYIYISDIGWDSSSALADDVYSERLSWGGFCGVGREGVLTAAEGGTFAIERFEPRSALIFNPGATDSCPVANYL